jgi:hypothetical protein
MCRRRRGFVQKSFTFTGPNRPGRAGSDNIEAPSRPDFCDRLHISSGYPFGTADAAKVAALLSED